MEGAQTTTLCPACGSGKIDDEHVGDSSLKVAGGERKQCMDCGWRGDKEKLVTVPLQANPNSLELDGDAALDVAKQISRNLMLLLGQHASQGLGLCIIEAGLCGRRDKKNLARLLKAGCAAAHQGILQEADNIAKEHSKGRILS